MNIAKEMFPGLYSMVEKAHRGIQCGHNIHHVIAVCNLGGRLSIEMRVTNKERLLVILACLLHNCDRELEALNGTKPTKNQVRELCMKRLRIYATLSDEDKVAVVEAVLEHDGPNKPEHSIVARLLRDADRRANT